MPLPIVGGLLIAAIVGLNGVVHAQKYRCLPPDVTESTVVSKNAKGTITARAALDKLKARCVRGRLVDRRQRGITFFQLQGCWGNPPEDHHEILQKQTTELARLRKKFTVIEITCNSTGQDIY